MTPAQVMGHLKARGAFIDLPTASHTGDIERVRELLRRDPSLANSVGEHEGYYLGAGAPLANAAAVGRMDIVQVLLDHGADSRRWRRAARRANFDEHQGDISRGVIS